MVYEDDNAIKIGGIILPGIYKKVEVTYEALIEEQEVKGSTRKPKQAIGYEDVKITVDIRLMDDMERTKEEKWFFLKNLFRTAGQEKPMALDFVSTYAILAGVQKVLIKNLKPVENNKTDEIAASLEIWEYIPQTITARKKKSTNANDTAANLNQDYAAYVENKRGSAPKTTNKTSRSPAVDSG